MIELNLHLIINLLIASFLGVVIGITAYFCKRMIDQNDKNFEKVAGRFDKLDTSLFEIRKELHTHDTSITLLEEKVEDLEQHCPLLGKTP